MQQIYSSALHNQGLYCCPIIFLASRWQIFNSLKNGGKITPDLLPAATKAAADK
jgi:hypothetical protein